MSGHRFTAGEIGMGLNDRKPFNLGASVGRGHDRAADSAVGLGGTPSHIAPGCLIIGHCDRGSNWLRRDGVGGSINRARTDANVRPECLVGNHQNVPDDLCSRHLLRILPGWCFGCTVDATTPGHRTVMRWSGSGKWIGNLGRNREP